MKTLARAPGLLGRRLPVGAEHRPGQGTHFRVWAPLARSVDVVFEGADAAPAHPLQAEDNGYFSALVPNARAGLRYRLRLDGDQAWPDPASRFQPEGPHGPSEIVDPAFEWSDAQWPGIGAKGQVLYELHIGTFTPEGTYAAAEAHFGYLKDLGVTTIELMPLNEFDGAFGWGYDGVNLFAPTHLYGGPDDLRRFIDRAHAAGLGVIHDVVYNHFGPSGNYLGRFSRDWVTDKYANEWGEPINFDGANSAPVREFFIANARYWIEEFHFDGLRLDATQCIFDDSETHVVAQIAQAARGAAPGKSIYITAENEPQHAKLVREQGVDALWNDDLHHSLHSAATGQCEAYYTETRGTPQELVSALKWGYLYQGQYYAWQKKNRGAPALDLPAWAFVNFLQNHDQIANSTRGQRLHELTTPARFRALTALVLLAPGTPMLFQGQEFAAGAPFLFFADHAGELGELVRKGRHEFLEQFPNVGRGAGRRLLDVPGDRATFERCKLDHAQREEQTHAQVLALHRDLLRLRREDPVFAAQDASRLHGAVLGPEAFLLRHLGPQGDDRLLVVNLGTTLPLLPNPEPLLAPPTEAGWRVLWASEDPRYGGNGLAHPDTGAGWRLTGHSLAVLAPANDKERDDG